MIFWENAFVQQIIGKQTIGHQTFGKRNVLLTQPLILPLGQQPIGQNGFFDRPNVYQPKCFLAKRF